MELRGQLDLLLLGTLQQISAAHGYALIAGLRDRSGGVFDLAEGTVYPALHRLERDGLVASEWRDGTPRRRRVYRLTPAGAAALASKQREWLGFVQAVQRTLERGVTEGWA